MILGFCESLVKKGTHTRLAFVSSLDLLRSINVLSPSATTPCVPIARTSGITFVVRPLYCEDQVISAETLVGVLDAKVSVSTAEISAIRWGVVAQIHVSFISQHP